MDAKPSSAAAEAALSANEVDDHENLGAPARAVRAALPGRRRQLPASAECVARPSTPRARSRSQAASTGSGRATTYWVTPTRPTEPLPDFTAPETGRVYRAAGEPPDPWPMNCFEVDGLAECNSDNSAAGWRLDIASNTAELYINAVDRIALTRGARRSFLGDLVDLKIEYDASRSNVFATLSRNAAASRNPAFYPCKGCCSNWPVPATATCETHWRTFARAEGF